MKKHYLLILFLGAVVVLLNGCSDRQVNEIPRVDAKKLVGTYSNSISVLLINVDNTYSIKTSDNKENGHWSVQYSNLKLTDSNGQTIDVGVIEVDGLYQLIFLEEGQIDPDTWDWSKIMTRDGQEALRGF